jgi:predicted cupin superfamily sugar epimerase
MDMAYSLKELIAALHLEPHPEGGFFRETYRSKEEIPGEHLGGHFSGSRNFSTCIYFLLTSDNFSAFHRINQDEIWHMYYGAPVRLHMISSKGQYSHHLIGADIADGQTPQFVVEGGNWFAAEVEMKDSYALMGCTVSPGFHYDDFELASKKELISMFPEHGKVINRLTRQ